MQALKAWVAGLAITFSGMTGLYAQIPGLPGAASPFAPGAGAGTSALGGLGAAGAPAAAPKTLWSCLGLSGASLQACRAKLCASQFGQMLNSMSTGPVAGLTGGFLPSVCPPAPNVSQIAALQQQPGGAAAAAGQIKASEADAKARVAAVEYLGTVDCSRWPEAQKALIYSLRDDPNECVRFAAARALNSGCCCNQEVIEALRISVSGEAKGGVPPETSSRVRASAFCALQNCLLRVPESLPPEVPPEGSSPAGPSEPPAEPGRSAQTPATQTHLAASYSAPQRTMPSPRVPLPRKTFAQTVDDARRTMFAVARTPRPPVVLTTGKRSLLDALSKARQDVNVASHRQAVDNRENPRMPPATAGAAEPVAAAPVQEDSMARPNVEPVSTRSSDELDPAPSTERASNARRGLLGMLFSSRDR